jgi:hypothetical protein
MPDSLLGRAWDRLERRFGPDSDDDCCGIDIEEARFESTEAPAGGGESDADEATATTDDSRAVDTEDCCA